MAARPATRHHPRATRRDRAAVDARPSATSRAVAASFTIDWDVRPVFDFLFSLTDDAGRPTTCPRRTGPG